MLDGMWAGGDDTIQIELAPPGALSGRLIDLEGTPRAGVTVEVTALAEATKPLDDWFERAAGNRRPGRGAWRIGRPPTVGTGPVRFPSSPEHSAALAAAGLLPTVQTDRQGRFSISKVGPDRLVVLRISSPAVARSAVKMVTRAGRSVFDGRFDQRVRDRMIHGVGATITIEPPAVVEGSVVDAESGEPIANCSVEVIGDGSNVSSGLEDFAKTATDERGRYSIGELSSDRLTSSGYRLRFTPPAGAPYFPTNFEVRGADRAKETVLDVRLPRARWISGRVIDEEDGRPIKALVGYLPTLGNTEVSAYLNFDSRASKTVSDDFRWNEPDGSFRVPAINGRGVLCVAAERLAAYPAARGLNRINGLEKRAVGFGVYHLYRPELVNDIREVDLSPDDEEPTIDVSLRAYGRRELRLVDAEGSPVSGCKATGLYPELTTAPRRGLHFDGAALESAETKVFGLEVESPRVVAFYHPKRNIGATLVMRHEEGRRDQPRAVTLRECGRIRGRLVDQSGRPVPGRWVRATGLSPVELPTAANATRAATFPVFTELVKTGADGRFEMDRRVVPGIAYKVHIYGRATGTPRPEAEPIVYDPPKETAVIEPGRTFDMGDLAPKEKAGRPAEGAGA